MKKDRYAVIPGNLGNPCDRFCDSCKDNPDTPDRLKGDLHPPRSENPPWVSKSFRARFLSSSALAMPGSMGFING